MRRRTLINDSAQWVVAEAHGLQVVVEACELGRHPIALLRGAGQIVARDTIADPLLAFLTVFWWAAQERTATIDECATLALGAYEATQECNRLIGRP